jgi:P4 family phage/plasmid primase-like protien
MDASLFQFLYSRTTPHESQYTHQTIETKKKYLIEECDMDEFWKLYQDHLPGFVDIGEKPRANSYTTIRGDFDIKIPESDADSYLRGNTHLYTQDDIIKVIELYHSVLQNYVKDIKPNQLCCCIMEKTQPFRSDGFIKSGFHIEFPFLLCSRNEQRAFLFPTLEKQWKECDIFSRFHDYPQHIFDGKAVLSNPWLLYGSKKSATKESYQLSMILNHELKEISLDDMMKVNTIVNENHEPIEFKDDGEWEEYLPQILSIIDTRKKKYMNELKPCDYSISKVHLQRLPPLEKDNDKLIPSNPTEALREAKLLLPMLSDSRASDYSSWFDIGRVLFNIGTGSADAYETWIEFSKRTKARNFSEANCITMWEDMKKSNYGIGTLIYYAKIDSPEEYNRFKNANSKTSLIRSVEKNGGQLTSYACAEALYHKYKNDFVYNGMGKDGWYKFENHRWNQIAEGIELRKLICTLRDPISEEMKKCRDRISEVENNRRDKEESNENADDEMKKVKELDKKRSMWIKEKNKLEDTPFKDKIMKECRDLFLDQTFDDKLNTNAHLMGFKNGVLDLERMEFREGRPIDYITLCTNIDFRDVGEREEEMHQINDYLLRVFPNEELRDYFLDNVAGCLKGGNINKKVVVWSGVGDNSKSIAEDLVKKAFGSYFHVFPTTLLTGKRTQSSGASPELIKSKGTRFAVIQEPSEKEEFNIGMLKELSGNDTIYVRGLYKDSTEILPQFKLVVICNKLPRIPSDDQATWNRVRVLDYESRFMNEADCPSTFDEQFKQKIFPKVLGFRFTDNMVQAFVSKLFSRFKENSFGIRKPCEPRQVSEATQIYRNKNDVYANFIYDRIIDDRDSHLTINDMYGSFREWFKNSFSYNHNSSKQDFKDYLSKHYKERFHVNRVAGIRYLSEEDEEKKSKRMSF